MEKKLTQQKKENLFFTIRDRIYSGYYWPREKLIETDLAKEMNVSRTIIREVLRELASKDLVFIVPYKGAFVAELSSQKVKELVQLEAILEGSAAYLATHQMGGEQIRELRLLLEEAETIKESQAWSPLNRKFHRRIITSCGNSKLIDIIRDNSRFLKYWFIKLAVAPEELDKRNKGHRKIVKAMEDKNAALARELMEEHIMDSVVNLMNKLQKANLNSSNPNRSSAKVLMQDIR